MDHASRGAAAMAASRYADAIQDYTEAIKSTPTSPDYYIKRSTAHQRSSPPDFVSALADAEKAVVLAQQRAKRELIVQAQLRRAIALFGVERYADSKFVLEIVKKLDAKEKTLAIWENKIETKLKAVDQEHVGAKVTVTDAPDIEYLPAVGLWKTKGDGNESTQQADVDIPVRSNPPPAAPTQTPADKIRHDWYQNHDNVIFTLLVKGAPLEDTTVDIQEQSLAISFPLRTGATYDLSLDPLYAPVDVGKSDFRVQSTKIEVTLRKAQPGQKWHALESKEPALSTQAPISTGPSASTLVSTAPAYPSSSRTGPKNWDKLANELTARKPKKEGEDTGGKDGADDDDYDYDREGGDEVNSFFKKLYAGADPDARRAMMKSFTESNGTALSTNWSEVKKAPVPTQPPDGIVAKPWN